MLVQYSLSHSDGQGQYQITRAQLELQFENQVLNKGSFTWSWQQISENWAILRAIYSWHIIARSILWAIPWNQIKQCFIVVYLLHLHKPNWSQAFHLLLFPEYIASLPGFLLHWWQSRVTALHFPQDMWSFVKTTQLCFQSHCCRILGGFFVSTDYLPHLVSRELSVFA